MNKKSETSSGKFYRGFKAECESIAIEMRKLVNLEPHQYLPAKILAKHLKIPILYPSEISGLSDTDMKCLGRKEKTQWSAVTTEFDGEKFIILNESHSDKRQESDLMHELAHVIRNHNMSILSSSSNSIFQLREYNEENEQEAIWLGGVLQLPRTALEWVAYKKMKIPEISEIYNSSHSMVQFRINKSGIKNQFKNHSFT